MTNFIAAVICLLLAFGGLTLRKTYSAVPARELKRRARHDHRAAELYRAVAYGHSLRTLLWLYIGLTGAASVVLLARLLPVWLSLLVVGPLLWIGFSLVPARRRGTFAERLTVAVTPLVTWLLEYLHPILSRGAEAVERHYEPPHTGLFERDDLLELIDHQRQQTDSRLSDEELEIVKRALRFDERQVADALTPRKQIKTVLADDVVGPILIDELHKNGQDCVLVRESKKGPFVGTLALKRLNIKSEGKVRDIMDDTIYYLHENDSLGQALHAFFLTNHAMFVVINNFEEYVGVLTVEDVLQELLGHIPGDDFDQYADPAAVVARHVAVGATAEPAEDSAQTSGKTEDEVIE